MDSDSYYKLQVLQQVEDSPFVTNRILSGKLGVSVKLAHYLLKKMVARGLLHMRRRDGRSWYYFLTPEGVAEKLKLTYEFLDFSKQFYHEARKRSSAVCLRLAREEVRRVAFLGVGELAEISFLGLAEHRLKLVDVFDAEGRAGELFLGLVVRPVAEIDRTRADRILVTLYDPAQPMRKHYLPAGLRDDPRFVWVFDHADMMGEIVEALPRAIGESSPGGNGSAPPPERRGKNP
ncbi:MAG: MarR family winged helix-turn-helix transcriptional regulator [Planctomycetota bacterium]